ncbi:hypothetical protein BDW42DRAFT_166033 [Aspergillus taichungensis]|uniref:Uncharacterized protein n=1 Tax=Aspergillus taichungensis TaxID=482145 RepID=A0A2J5HZ48_9EURO|nr:hypothetical protein BDW42DRAFT_166033 [Aspergillus taichungensis]
MSGVIIRVGPGYFQYFPGGLAIPRLPGILSLNEVGYYQFVFRMYSRMMRNF